ncbi:type II toxin-antitoxin system MqsA family antitoxin [bacterium]|nr:type II toxin-antitoxin system MqsA family antitoxin [bacterium]QQR59846.1 MAG: type II toxin-antitoxin system MqsA family antitoxin [Candidatus Melainabacteria bacterium]
MKCLFCGKAKMIRGVKDVTYTYKGQTTIIPKVGGEYCPECDESIHSGEESEYLSDSMLSFNKEVNSESVDPEFIVKTRKKLRLDQREAAEIFGGGANAFSRYETGKTRPPVALVQLLKLLNSHPELLEELRPPSKLKEIASTSRRKLKRRTRS